MPRTLDDYFPPRGPCAFCGGPDARHRLFDTLRGMHHAGDSVDLLARVYRLPPEAVRLAIEAQIEGMAEANGNT